MKIYLAAAYGRRLEMRGYRDQLVEMGHTVTSRWINQDEQDETPTAGYSLADLTHNVAEAAERAILDGADVLDADTLISFTDGQLARGGRHVEFGMGIAWGKHLVVIGPREHVFHALPEVEQYICWESFRTVLAARGTKPDWRDPVPRRAR